MEKLKNKHDHALTQWLKVIIFSILMLAPFFSVASKCLYVACNKNAKDSYSGDTTYEINYKYQSNEVNSVDDLVIGNIYEINFPVMEAEEIVTSGYIQFALIGDSEFYFETATFLGDDGAYPIYNSFILININNSTITCEGLYDLIPTYELNNVSCTNCIVEITSMNNLVLGQSIDYYGFTNCFSYTDYNEIESVDIDNTGTLDNAFEYGVNQLTTTPAFAWTKNTAIYTPINAMTEGLGFTQENNVIAVLLTYWSLLTAIYILFDIIISLFVKITHLIS